MRVTLRSAMALMSCLVASSAIAGEAVDWSGFYAGVHGGFGSSSLEGVYDSDDIDPGDVFVDDGEGTFALNADDFVGGVQVGYSKQFEKFVIGIEGDLSLANWSDSLKYGSDDDELSTNTRWLASARGRFGLALGDMFVFATGGLAWSDTSFTGNDDYPDTDPGEIGTVDFGEVGVVYGAGLEYALGGGFAVKAEGLVYRFDQEIDITDLQSDTKPGDTVTFNDAVVVRAGLNYRF
jgi:outer membrane immunogenic protein